MAREKVFKDQAGEELNARPRTVNDMIKDGRLPEPNYLFGRAFWWRDEFDAAVEKGISRTPRKTPQEYMAMRGSP